MNIRSLRESVNMSQKELSITMRVSQPTISDWENGKTIPSIKNMVRLAEIFGITVDELMEGNAINSANEEQLKMDAMRDEAFQIMKDMSEAEQKQVYQFIHFLKSSRKE